VRGGLGFVVAVALVVVRVPVVGVAAGTWLLSLLFDSRAAMAAAFVLGALGGVSHLAYLGRPERALRMAMRVRTSWIARGFWGLSLFLGGSFLYLAPLMAPALPWSGDSAIAAAGLCSCTAMALSLRPVRGPTTPWYTAATSWGRGQRDLPAPRPGLRS
jgi:DMSO reductase anchor subunit